MIWKLDNFNIDGYDDINISIVSFKKILLFILLYDNDNLILKVIDIHLFYY